jgi:hypothetical protein
MYQFEATVYEDHDGTNCHGAVWEGEKKRGEPLMTAHCHLPWSGDSSGSGHAYIVQAIDAVCTEIAENLDDVLF